MMVVKRIICLAKSWRPGGYCIAGREILYGRVKSWIRPVGYDEAVPVWASKYRNGSELKLLDIADVGLLDFIPIDHQQENWLLNTNQKWIYRGRFNKKLLVRLCDEPETLWENGHSTSRGMNDYVPYEDAKHEKDSLRLIRVDHLTLLVFGANSNRTRVQGHFRYNGTEYKLWVKDVQYEDEYVNHSDGNHPIGECYLTISLAGNYEGNCYKLIAGIIPT